MAPVSQAKNAMTCAILLRSTDAADRMSIPCLASCFARVVSPLEVSGEHGCLYHAWAHTIHSNPVGYMFSRHGLSECEYRAF